MYGYLQKDMIVEQTSYYSEVELNSLGFKSVGANVKVSRFSRFYGVENIEIGGNVRIDDFCILSGAIRIGNYVHIAAYSAIFAGEEGRVTIEDYAGLSSRVTIYAKSDDYSGDYMTNPAVFSGLTNIIEKPVVLKKHVIVGAGAILMPGVTLGAGSAIGAMSLVKSDTEESYIYAGVPARKVKPRSKKLFDLECKFVSMQADS